MPKTYYGSPTIQFRLPKKELRRLEKVAKLIKRPSASILVRDLMRSAFSDNPLSVFQEIQAAIFEQQQLKLELAGTTLPTVVVSTAKKAPRGDLN